MKRAAIIVLTFLSSLFFFHSPAFATETLWSKTPLTEGRVFSLVSSGNTLFAGTSKPESFINTLVGGVHRSTDGGQTWQSVGLTGTTVEAMTLYKGAIFASLTESYSFFPIGIYRSVDNGNSWTHVGPLVGFLSFTQFGDTLFAGSQSGNGGVYRSSDGVNWQQIGLVGYTIEELSANSTGLYALARSYTLNGLFRSSDGGLTWQFMQTGNGQGGLFADDHVILSAQGPTLWRSIDDGLTFQIINNVPGLGFGAFGPITSDGKTYYMGNWRGLNGLAQGGVIRSTDLGATWQAINDGLEFTGPTSSVMRALLYYPPQKKLYAAAFNQGLWAYQANSLLPPVILIPGLTGTELIHDQTGYAAWVDVANLATSLNDNFLDVIKLNSDGKTSADSHFGPGKVIELIDLPGNLADQHIYDILKKFLLDIGYKENDNFFLFSYDWRRDINNNGWPTGSKTTIQRLDELINSLPEKPILLTHSLGGLVSRQYILESSRAAKVKNVITLGTPWSGTPGSFVTLHYGHSDIAPLNKNKAKELANNFTSFYEILPTKQYFDHYSSYFIDQTDRDHDGITGALTFDQTQNLLKTMHNPAALSFATTFHNQGIGDWSTGTNGIPVYTVVGTGVGTPGTIREWYEKNLLQVQTQKQSYTCIDGDGAVPFYSAKPNITTSTQTVFYAKNVDHTQLPSDSNVQELIRQILLGQPVVGNSIVSKTVQSTFTGTCLKVFSPVSLHIYDEQGNHDGPVEGADYEVNIPNSRYDILGESKIAVLPSGNFRVELKAEQPSGTFDLSIDTISNGNIDKTDLFNDIPIASSTAQAKLTITSNISSPLSTDVNGDGVFEQDITPSGTSTSSLDITAPKTTITLAGTLGKNDWYVSTVSATLTATDASGSGVLETRYRLNNEETKKYTVPLDLPQDGIATISAQSIDNIGNTEEPIQKTIRKDSQPPTITIGSPTTTSFMQGENVLIQFSATDSISGIASASATLNGQPITNGNSMLFDKVGKQTLVITAEDNAGNKAIKTVDVDVVFLIDARFETGELYLTSTATYVKIAVTLPDIYDTRDIDLSTVRIDDLLPAILEPIAQDKKRQKLIVRFDRAALIEYLKTKNPQPDQKISLTISGKMKNGIGFKGKAEVIVKY